MTDLVKVQRITHGRHCVCSACAQEDWTNPQLAPCGMHGSSCPREYAPLGAAGDIVGAGGRIDKTDPRVWRVAQILDHPSVYMGGPKQSSFRKAQQIVDELDAMDWRARGLEPVPGNPSTEERFA